MEASVETIWPPAVYTSVHVHKALSILQNGKCPKLNKDILQILFGAPESSESLCISKLQIGSDTLGINEICRQLPSFVFLFQPTSVTLTFKKLTSFLKPEFDSEGSNKNIMERKAYSAFLRYLREVASGRREKLSLGSILQFVTGSDEEPALGFNIHLNIKFTEADMSYLPTANTHINCLALPRPPVSTDSLLEDNSIFELIMHFAILIIWLTMTLFFPPYICTKLSFVVRKHKFEGDLEQYES